MAVPGADLVELGAITRAHGLRGEVLVKPFNPKSELLETLAEGWLKDATGAVQTCRVQSAARHGEHLRVALAGVGSREAADALRGSTICVPRDHLPALEPGEYYLVDVVGFDVVDAEGRAVGTVTDAVEYPTVCSFVVQGDAWVREIPDLPRYVQAVDLAAHVVRVDHLEEIECVPAGKAHKAPF